MLAASPGVLRGAVHTQVKDKPKSMLAAKSFEPINDMAAMDRWIAIMADELASRMADDYEQHLRRPRNLIIHYRQAYCQT